MPIRPRKKQEVVKRQRQVTDVYLEGWTQHKIARTVECAEADHLGRSMSPERVGNLSLRGIGRFVMGALAWRSGTSVDFTEVDLPPTLTASRCRSKAGEGNPLRSSTRP